MGVGQTGSATAIVVASNAQARLTIAIEVKDANKRQPGLNASMGGPDVFDMMLTGLKTHKQMRCKTMEKKRH